MKSFDELVNTIETLRSENGCPWDRKQTLADLKKYLIEEVYELCDAIDQNDGVKIAEESGDVLLNLLLISTILKEKKISTPDNIINNVTQKIINRHPHVFGDTKAANADEALINWHISKKKNENKKLFGDIPISAPALTRAYIISKRAAKIGFGFENIDQLYDKMEEEFKEMKAAVNNESIKEIDIELGDILFTLVNLGVFLDIYPEDSLKNSCEKFLKRFRYIEEKLDGEGKEFLSSRRQDIEKIWDESKK